MNTSPTNMSPYSEEPRRDDLFGLRFRHWKTALALGAIYLLVMWFSEKFIPHPATLFPASAIALSALFIEGIEFWPVIYVASLIGYLFLGSPIAFIILLPIAQALQAVVGAYLLRITDVDPLFRRSRHTFSLIGMVLLVSLIVPSLSSVASILSALAFHVPVTLSLWFGRYIGTLFCLLILTPFLLRWRAKTRFSRTWPEIIELIIVFGILIIIDFFLFIQGIDTLGGISLVYFLLLPLFWIALRMRPRFITLALFITSVFSIYSIYLTTFHLSSALFSARLIQMEELLIVIATIFLIISSLEEDRRLNSNLTHTQMATLENAIARVSSESNAKNDFIAILAHELRNPLAPVLSGIELLKLKNDRNVEELETLTMMEDRMRTVRRLLDDLLDISRIAEGKITLRKERTELQTVLKRATLSTTHHIKERHQSLNLKLPEKPLYIQGDAVRLEQVFSNLLTNASKYSDSGDQITITVRKTDGDVEITISDTGVGIAPELLEDVFTPFHQVDSGARSKKGLGIGLALVRSFVEMHDGTIIATSEGIGKGSQFTVSLPLEGEDEKEPMTPSVSDSENERRSKQAKDAEKDTDGLHILIVDDNDAAAWGMGRLLELRGCTISYAYNGRQAIEEVGHLSPDVILLDIGLPDQDGYAVAKTIRARGYRGRLIALTGYSTEDARVKGRDAGFEHYLIKPAGFADLKRVIPEIA